MYVYVKKENINRGNFNISSELLFQIFSNNQSINQTINLQPSYKRKKKKRRCVLDRVWWKYHRIPKILIHQQSDLGCYKLLFEQGHLGTSTKERRVRLLICIGWWFYVL